MMCYGNPAKSLEIARSRLTPEQWARFEREFDDFCVVQGMHAKTLIGVGSGSTVDWAKWAFFCARSAAEVRIKALEIDIAENDALIDSLRESPAADQRVADAKYTRLAIAIMDDEQAVASLERWKQR